MPVSSPVSNLTEILCKFCFMSSEMTDEQRILVDKKIDTFAEEMYCLYEDIYSKIHDLSHI